MVVQSHLCVFVIIWPTLRVASRQLVAATGEESSPIASQSGRDYPKPISGINEVEMVKKINGEGGGLI